MADFKKLISESLKSEIEDLTLEEITALIEVPPNKEMGDYAFPCFKLAKVFRKAPNAIAEDLAGKIQPTDDINKIINLGGYVNFFVNKESLAKKVINQVLTEKENYGKSEFGKGKTVVVEFSSPNIAKPFHIGHVRTTVIGNALSKIYASQGYHVEKLNHLGDYGTQFGKLIVAYKLWGDKQAVENDPIKELLKLYIRFHDEAETKPEMEDEAREWFTKLENGDEEAKDLWQWFRDESLKEFSRVYKLLDIDFDSYVGESFYSDKMPAVIEELKEKNIAKEDQGALVVFFEEDKLPPALVQKKDGSFLYATSDLATIKFRKNELNVDKAVYVTDERQQNHFKQVFEISEMLGAPYNYEKSHVYFGIMRFGDGMIFSSRSGNIIRLVDLLDEAKKQVKSVIDEKNPNIPEDEKEKIAEIVGTGAIKYFDLSQNRTSDILFTWDKVLSFEGNTGPYLQYTYARIQSILRKLKEENISVENNDIILDDMFDIERELAVALLRFPQTVVKSYETYRPNIIADYLFDTAKLFNNFYNSKSILKETDKKVMDARILLAQKTASILKQGLNLLGIETVDRM